MARSRTLRRWIAQVIAAWCVLVSTPGAFEAARDLAHFLCEGHTVHAAAHDGDQEAQHDHESSSQDEHGCSGFFHVCRCCGQAQVIVIGSVPPVLDARAIAELPLRLAADGALTGFRTQPFRPPSV